MDFISVDVETANPDRSSICQIGIVCFREGKIVEQWESLINPEDYFDEMNVFIHGIDESDVEDAPKLTDVHDKVVKYFNGNVVVSHTSFDRVAFERAFAKYNLTPPDCKWLDSAKVVRRAWTEFSQKGYGLTSVSKKLGIQFEPHVAQEDARAAGEILIQAINTSGVSLNDWFDRVKKPINPSGATSVRISKEGNPEGPLFGEIIVFTGALTIPRREAAETASKIGCQVESGVNRQTTMLVFGDQDIRKLAGHEKSKKHRKAEELVSKGQAIRFLTESDFRQLIAIDGLS
jgi:DNA polymerase-3 subunit epsilon